MISFLNTITLLSPKLLAFPIWILTATTVCGQVFEPLEIAKIIFEKDSLPDIGNYVSGEYKGRPNGQDLPKGSTQKFSLLEQTEKTAVVGMTVLDSLGKGMDTYLHFRRDTGWKMIAFRSLAMTGTLEQIKIGLENMSSEQIDEMIAKSKKLKNRHFAMFASREDYNFQLGNAKLILEMDDNIVEHFSRNQTEFERLKNAALTQLMNENISEEKSIRLIQNLKTDYQRLFISSVSSGDYELGNCINFLIGGMLDNSVGYIYVKDKKDLPEMNPNGIIMIREIGNGWYIYKTT
jgi:hypothetical protein